jgi:hypothetical protein
MIAHGVGWTLSTGPHILGKTMCEMKGFPLMAPSIYNEKNYTGDK